MNQKVFILLITLAIVPEFYARRYYNQRKAFEYIPNYLDADRLLKINKDDFKDFNKKDVNMEDPDQVLGKRFENSFYENEFEREIDVEKPHEYLRDFIDYQMEDPDKVLSRN